MDTFLVQRALVCEDGLAEAMADVETRLQRYCLNRESPLG